MYICTYLCTYIRIKDQRSYPTGKSSRRLRAGARPGADVACVRSASVRASHLLAYGAWVTEAGGSKESERQKKSQSRETP